MASEVAIRNVYLWAKELKRTILCLGMDGSDIPSLPVLRIAASLFPGGVWCYHSNPTICEAMRAIVHLDWSPDTKDDSKEEKEKNDNPIRSGFEEWFKQQPLSQQPQNELKQWIEQRSFLSPVVTFWYGDTFPDDHAVSSRMCVLVHKTISSSPSLVAAASSIPVFIWCGEDEMNGNTDEYVPLALQAQKKWRSGSNKNKTLYMGSAWHRMLHPPPKSAAKAVTVYPGIHNAPREKERVIMKQFTLFDSKMFGTKS